VLTFPVYVKSIFVFPEEPPFGKLSATHPGVSAAFIAIEPHPHSPTQNALAGSPKPSRELG